MKRGMVGLILLGIILIVGCDKQIVCNKPYIHVGTECCLDIDNNNICDKDEGLGKGIETKEYAPIKEEKTEIEQTLDKLGKVCIITFKENNEFDRTFPEIRDCSSDKECLDYVYSLALADGLSEIEAQKIMDRYNIKCDLLSEEQKKIINEIEENKVIVSVMDISRGEVKDFKKVPGTDTFHFGDKCYWDGTADINNRGYLKATNIRVKAKFKFGGIWYESKNFHYIGTLNGRKSESKVKFYMEFDCPKSQELEDAEWIIEYD